MKRIALATAALLLFGASFTFAQTAPATPQTPGPKHHSGMRGQKMTPENRLQRLSQKLNLTDAQKNSIKPILENENKQMKALHDDTSIARQDKWAKMQDIHKNTFDQIRPVLNPDQQAKLDQMQKNQQERMQQRHAHRGKRGQMGAPANQPSTTQPSNPQ